MVLREVGAVFVVVLATARDARGEAPCFSAFTNGQQAAVAGKVLEARRQFSACLADTTCPAAPLLKDCAAQLEAATARVGSIVVTLSNGSTSARIVVDGVEVATMIDGRAIELDPGDHRVVVSRPGGADITTNVLVAEGAKLKQIVIDVPAPVPPSPTRDRRRNPHYAAWTLGGVGVTLGIGFGVLAGVGQATYDGCQSACSSSTLSTLRAERAVAWTLFGVGVAALITSAVLFAVKF